MRGRKNKQTKPKCNILAKEPGWLIENGGNLKLVNTGQYEDKFSFCHCSYCML